MPIAERIVMASGSSFRKALLASTGLVFETQTSEFDESLVKDRDPKATAALRALGKGRAVAEKQPGAVVLSGDQVLALDGEQLRKVKTKEEAVARLSHMSGKTHHLLSAYALIINDQGTIKTLHEDVVEVPMVMRSFSSEEAEAYVSSSYEWQGVVGCYQYENRGANLFDRVGGDHSSIIGLPLIPLLTAFRKIGINPLTNPSGPWTLTI